MRFPIEVVVEKPLPVPLKDQHPLSTVCSQLQAAAESGQMKTN